MLRMPPSGVAKLTLREINWTNQSCRHYILFCTGQLYLKGEFENSNLRIKWYCGKRGQPKTAFSPRGDILCLFLSWAPQTLTTTEVVG